MNLVRCRQCDAEITSDCTLCPECGAEEPVVYRCFVCRAAIEPEVMLQSEARGPYGFTHRLTVRGEPLCERHAEIECNHPSCSNRVRAELLVLRITGWKPVDLSGVEQYEPVKEYYCPLCAAQIPEPPCPDLPVLSWNTRKHLLTILAVASVLSLGAGMAIGGFTGQFSIVLTSAAAIWAAVLGMLVPIYLINRYLLPRRRQ